LRRTEVQCSGRRRFTDGVLAHVRTPAAQQALRNHYFDSLSLPRLYISAKPNPVEPPWYVTRMSGGVGGVAPRGVPPVPISGTEQP
jgi:hypothetical protein